MGLVYADTAATNGARLWVSTGTTNTSWTVAVGDTGLRKIDTLLVNGWAAISYWKGMNIRRIGSVVFVQGALNSAAATSDVILSANIPGFSAGTGRITVGPAYSFGLNAFLPLQQKNDATGFLQLPRAGAGEVYPSASWVTPDAWPTTLPGVPA
ncbi:MAG: hypothetical protein EOL90_12770 [Spartobacteria bacterium]|nr:hypothetical protein [Spartobacteria bacterium]